MVLHPTPEVRHGELHQLCWDLVACGMLLAAIDTLIARAEVPVTTADFMHGVAELDGDAVRVGF